MSGPSKRQQVPLSKPLFLSTLKLFVDLLLDFLNQLPDGKSNHMVSRFPSFGVFMKVFVRSPELFLAH